MKITTAVRPFGQSIDWLSFAKANKSVAEKFSNITQEKLDLPNPTKLNTKSFLQVQLLAVHIGVFDSLPNHRFYPRPILIATRRISGNSEQTEISIT